MKKREKRAPIDPEILKAIRSAHPSDVVTSDAVYDEDGECRAISEALYDDLLGMTAYDMLYERSPKPESSGTSFSLDESEPDVWDDVVWEEESTSYHLMFLALRGPQFVFEGEGDTEEYDDELDCVREVNVTTEGRIGCAVGISILAPFAVVHFTDMEFGEDGSVTTPDIWVDKYNLDGTPLDLDAHYRELFLDEGLKALHDLREELTGILEAHGIRVLSREELATPVPGLKPDPTMSLLGTEAEAKEATVENALFFPLAD